MFCFVGESTVFLIKIVLVIVPKFCASKMEEKIVGGAFANIKEFPHSVYIESSCSSRLRWACGASILNQRIIVTAGHCLTGCDTPTVHAYAGSANMTAIKTGICRNIDRIVVHPRYNERPVLNDIALASVEDAFPLNNDIKRLIIPRIYQNPQAAVIAGWGSIDVNDTDTDHLKFATLEVEPPEECRKIMGFDDGMLCAKAADEQRSHPARGDSGSALVTADYKQIGIGLASWGPRHNWTVGVYSNLTYFYDWILDEATSLYCDFEM